MFKVLFGAATFIFKGLYMLILPLLVIKLFSRRKEGLLRRLLRFSYNLYSSLLKGINPYVVGSLGIDLLDGYPRIVASIALSVLIGYGLLSLIHLRLRMWMAVLLVLHGLFIGKEWDHINAPKDFQMGARIDE
jgi:ABC-type spermidine/putrescine transport system permease subunit II